MKARTNLAGWISRQLTIGVVDAAELIKAGRVELNEVPVADPTAQAEHGDFVVIDGPEPFGRNVLLDELAPVEGGRITEPTMTLGAWLVTHLGLICPNLNQAIAMVKAGQVDVNYATVRDPLWAVYQNDFVMVFHGKSEHTGMSVWFY